MKRQIAVIGLGRFGYSVAKELAVAGSEVLAIDRDEERVSKVADYVTHAVVLNATDEKALRSVGVQNMDIAIVSIGENIEANILVVMLLKELGVHRIIAKAVTSLHGKVLESLKVDRIVYPERDMAVRTAHWLIQPNIIEQLELSPEYSIIELPAPTLLVGKTLRDSELRTRYGANLIAIKKLRRGEEEAGHQWNVNPLPTDIIQKDDLLVLIGRTKDLERLSESGR